MEVLDVIELSPAEVRNIEGAIRQTNAIFALEGFEPDDFTRAIDAAVLAGRVSRMQAGDEMRAWVAEHKTTDGFIESRAWV